jgi:hypothetical protein
MQTGADRCYRENGEDRKRCFEKHVVVALGDVLLHGVAPTGGRIA